MDERGGNRFDIRTLPPDDRHSREAAIEFPARFLASYPFQSLLGATIGHGDRAACRLLVVDGRAGTRELLRYGNTPGQAASPPAKWPAAAPIPLALRVDRPQSPVQRPESSAPRAFAHGLRDGRDRAPRRRKHKTTGEASRGVTGTRDDTGRPKSTDDLSTRSI
jgi:hypothetical protein